MSRTGREPTVNEETTTGAEGSTPAASPSSDPSVMSSAIVPTTPNAAMDPAQPSDGFPFWTGLALVAGVIGWLRLVGRTMRPSLPTFECTYYVPPSNMGYSSSGSRRGGTIESFGPSSSTGYGSPACYQDSVRRHDQHLRNWYTEQHNRRVAQAEQYRHDQRVKRGQRGY
jgi:hypothetical protein